MRPAFEPPGDVAWGVSMLEMPGVHGASLALALRDMWHGRPGQT
jgi:hypothetical protein